jgi:hypothetical protein
MEGDLDHPRESLFPSIGGVPAKPAGRVCFVLYFCLA